MIDEEKDIIADFIIPQFVIFNKIIKIKTVVTLHTTDKILDFILFLLEFK